MKTECRSCGTSILPSTANNTNGLCMPCSNRNKNIFLKLITSLSMLLIFIVSLPYIIWTKLYIRLFGHNIHKLLVSKLNDQEFAKFFENKSSVEVHENKCLLLLLKMKNQVLPGDELWLYRSPEKEWQKLRGREGVCLKRGNKIIDNVVTFMN